MTRAGQARRIDAPWLAVAGKGGVGKSVISGTLARVLARRGRPVLGIDSDPMPGMTRSLGVAEPPGPPLLAAAAERDGYGWRLKKGIGPMRAVQRFTTVAPDGVRLLQLGKAAPDSVEAFTDSVNTFVQLVRRLPESQTLRGWTVVGDLPAGPRHVAAGFAAYVQLFVIVVEPASQSALAARRVAHLARQHLAADVLFVGSKIAGADDRGLAESLLGEPLELVVPVDAEVPRAERAGRALLDAAPRSAAVRAIEDLADLVEERSLGPR